MFIKAKYWQLSREKSQDIWKLRQCEIQVDFSWGYKTLPDLFSMGLKSCDIYKELKSQKWLRKLLPPDFASRTRLFQ